MITPDEQPPLPRGFIRLSELLVMLMLACDDKANKS
jgi:hypothetical protein